MTNYKDRHIRYKLWGVVALYLISSIVLNIVHVNNIRVYKMIASLSLLVLTCFIVFPHLEKTKWKYRFHMYIFTAIGLAIVLYLYYIGFKDYGYIFVRPMD